MDGMDGGKGVPPVRDIGDDAVVAGGQELGDAEAHFADGEDSNRCWRIGHGGVYLVNAKG